ncbi:MULTISPECIES: O-antigen ligase [Myxococcaceae]|uniref:O-antigen ligase family protein n=1 Tax=Myxococcaceae TaxID=31 RepID=UPI00129C255A|nr:MULTISPECIES: O-antigen ligase family protein [Myxococcaceae]MBF5041214.1 O-antigen ligase family protein [Simulacricoccus sp. 17bor-14]
MVGEQGRQRDVLAFYCLTAFAFCMYAVPGEWIPALAPLRLALLTSGLAAGLVVMRRVGRAEPFFLDGVRGVSLMCFSVVVVASMSWSINPLESRAVAIEVLKLSAIYLAVVNVVTNEKRLTVILGAFVLGSIITSIGVINWYLVGENLVEGFRARWVGIYADPNRTAMNVGIVVPLAVAFIARKGTGWLFRIACTAAAVLAVVAIVFTHSRGGFGGLATAMALWAIREKRRLQAIVLGAVFALGLVVFAPESFWKRNETVTEFHQDASAMGRVYAWQVASRISLDKPLLGVGAGGFRFAWPLYAPPESHRAYVAHDLFLEVLGELGWVGFFLFLIFAGGAVGGAFEASLDPNIGWVARALGASIVGYLICQLSAGYIQSAHLYMLFGLAASAERLARMREATALVPQRGPASAPSEPLEPAWEPTRHAL